ncbi:hypothetical protein A1O3_00500 [Capronia epimyces CBS 606.96]|uniref:Uncharacterized protein n=1 Tax=Capronia epimyces CBS 606.96 TaxID=1182542 RepID=W9YQM1_9EURO|nr:uncharacterized protein A1O3_00500 [Capronia epimyces CBS 606.96]EXJ91950.1 hypothetical protein A1O3_00500 [Capronia epimyces CBS 606.96]
MMNQLKIKPDITITVYRFISIGLILVLAYSILCISIVLRAKGAVCSATAAGIDFSLGLSIPTILVVGSRCYLAIRQRQRQRQKPEAQAQAEAQAQIEAQVEAQVQAQAQAQVHDQTTTISPSSSAPPSTPPHPRLERLSVHSVRCLMLLWMILGCCNLLVALRAPICLNQPLDQWRKQQEEQQQQAGDRDRDRDSHTNILHDQIWRYGMSCRLHRGLVALSILMALSVCLLSILDRIVRGRLRPKPSSCWCWRCWLERFTTACHLNGNKARSGPDQSWSRLHQQHHHQQHRHCGSVPSLSSSTRSGLGSISVIDKDDHRLFLIPERRPAGVSVGVSSRLEHEQWLQRRNSLSSQKAIYPHKYQHLDPRQHQHQHQYQHQYLDPRQHQHQHQYQYLDPRLRYGWANINTNGTGSGTGIYNFSPAPHLSSLAPSSRYSNTLRSVSEGVSLDLNNRERGFGFGFGFGFGCNFSSLPSSGSSSGSSSDSGSGSGSGSGSTLSQSSTQTRPSTLSSTTTSRTTPSRANAALTANANVNANTKTNTADSPTKLAQRLGLIQDGHVPQHSGVGVGVGVGMEMGFPVKHTTAIATSSLARKRSSGDGDDDGDGDGSGDGRDDSPPLPAAPAPAWSPALHHAPLSADPTIRALSTGILVGVGVGTGKNGMNSTPALTSTSLHHSRSSPGLLAQLASPTTNDDDDDNNNNNSSSSSSSSSK